MLRTTLLASSAVAALVLLTACEQPAGPQSQQQAEQHATPQTEDQMAPSAAERAAAEAANEVDQAAVPTTQIDPAEIAAGVNAGEVTNPEATFSTASVRTSSGESVGEVRQVVVGPDGKAAAVIVEVGGFLNVGERAVSIEADKFTYLKSRNILVASLGKTEIERMEPTTTNP